MMGNDCTQHVRIRTVQLVVKVNSLVSDGPSPD